jgi:hypothetical protein
MSLVQISLVHVKLDKKPRAQRPVFELELRDDQQLVGFQNYWTIDLSIRETVDHHANVWVATKL